MKYNGSCHCQRVQFTVEAPETLTVIKCNCSICFIKQNHHFIVPESNLEITQGFDSLTEYRFNTEVAVHLFCKYCGVQAFYKPRSNPDGYGINIHVIQQDQIQNIQWEEFNGQEWDQAYARSDIQKYSKTT